MYTSKWNAVAAFKFTIEFRVQLGGQHIPRTQWKNQTEQFPTFIHPKNNLLSTSYISGTVLAAGNREKSWTWSPPSMCKWKMICNAVYITDARTEMSQMGLGSRETHSEGGSEYDWWSVGRGYSRRRNGM